MNPRDETDITGDPYLAKCIEEIRAMQEVFKMNEAQREWARQADERCPSCGRLGYRYRCPACERG